MLINKSHLLNPLRWLIINLYYKPRKIVSLLINRKKICQHESYYPEKKQKSSARILREQILSIIKYGAINEFYFPYGFDVKSKEEQEPYLHYNPFMKIRDKNNIHPPHSSTFLLRDKLHFAITASFLGINIPQNVGIVDKGTVFDISKKQYLPMASFFSNLTGEYFVKPIGGECGEGIYCFKVSGQEIFIDGKKILPENIENILGNGRYIVQCRVEQHPLMSSLHPESLNTIRLVTIRDKASGEIMLFPSILRIGTGSSKVDNTSQGGIAVGVDLKNGNLKGSGYYKPKFGTKVAIHPDSKVVFSEFKIPYFNEAANDAKRFHAFLPDIQSIGWDIAIGVDGPVFIEGNDNWEINGPQICNGGLKREFTRLSLG